MYAQINCSSMTTFLKKTYCALGLTLASCSKALTPEDQTVLHLWQRSPYCESLSIGKKKRVNISACLEPFWSLLRPPSTCIYSIVPDREAIISSQEAWLSLFAKVCGHNSPFYPLVATVTEEKRDLETTIKLLKCIHQSNLSSPIKNLFTEEALAKILAYRTCNLGDEFAISSNGPLLHYEINAIFPMGGGIPAYGCIPIGEEGPPLLLFRGSEFSFNQRGRVTFKANVDFQGPGYSMYLSARPLLRSWLEKQTNVFGKAKVLGFSLGGTLAAYAVVLDSEFFHAGVAFNMAGVRKKIANQWQQINDAKRPKFISYVNQGDAVSKIGNLFGDVYQCTFPTPLRLIKAHNLLLLSEPTIILNPVHVDKENRSSRILSNL